MRLSTTSTSYAFKEKRMAKGGDRQMKQREEEISSSLESIRTEVNKIDQRHRVLSYKPPIEQTNFDYARLERGLSLYQTVQKLKRYLAVIKSETRPQRTTAVANAKVHRIIEEMDEIASPPWGDECTETVIWDEAGILHCVFEGYFVTHHDRMGPAQDVLGQLWKEYAKSDSRYLASDSFVVSIETITVVLWGPLCLVVAYLTTANHPLKHPLRVIVCMAHLYGDALYYATSLFDCYVNGVSHSRPEALYFWVYYFLLNFVWIVVPGLTKLAKTGDDITGFMQSYEVNSARLPGQPDPGARLGPEAGEAAAWPAAAHRRADNNNNTQPHRLVLSSSLPWTRKRHVWHRSPVVIIAASKSRHLPPFHNKHTPPPLVYRRIPRIPMPSPATPRGTTGPGRDSARSSPTKLKPLDIGKPLGAYDSNSVREKVRIWQQKGGGVATVKDALADLDGSDNLPSQTRPDKPDKPGKAVDRRRVTTRVKNADSNVSGVASGGIRKRSQSTPRKRVVSDQHWRKQRSPPTASKPARGPPPNRITVYKTNETLSSSSVSLTDKSPYRKDHVLEVGKSSKFGVEGTRASALAVQKKPRATKTTKYIYKDDGHYPEKGLSQGPEMSESSFNDEESGQSILEGMRRTTPPPKDNDEWAASEADFSELSRRRRRGPSIPQETRKPKSGLLNQVIDESRKMFAKPAPPRAPPVASRGDKIAAWLSAQPDPFVDGNDDTPVEIPAPLKTRSRTARALSRSSESRILEESSDISSATNDQSADGKSGRKDYQRRSSGPGVAGGKANKARESPALRHKERTTSIRRKSKSESSSVISKQSNEDLSSTPTKSSRMRDGTKQDDHVALDDMSELSAQEKILPLRLRRPFPSTGMHQLSTVASEETLSSDVNDRSVIGSETNLSKSEITESAERELDDEKRDHFDPESLPNFGSGLQRRLTKHSDLMSILSNPKSGRRSVRSSRSIRSIRTRLETATMADLMKELSSDETKYMRELRTLVGGVIPVLLSCVLSRSDSAIAAGLFRPSADPKDDINFTRPIVDMGVALERLKTLHKRIPLEDPEPLLGWAQGAQKVYRDYLKAWRMGFQDVVVNLAPLDEDESAKLETQSLDQGLDRDENGDIIDSDGEKVDVAYLLKRPLVRLKYLFKTFKGIDFVEHSPKAQQIAEAYQELVERARQRSHEERARLEDESAAYIDSTRARDTETLAVLTDVVVDKTRRVLARDFFNLSLMHSSGQMIDCHAELLLRDNAPDTGPGGDLLICEIDDTDRWLLFPPIETNCVSARSGERKGEIVVMVRGKSATEDGEWQELLSLTIDDEESGFEWVKLLGLEPVPPPIPRIKKFVDRTRSRRRKASNETTGETSSSLTTPKLRLPSPSQIDVPIGEQASVISRAGKSSTVDSSGPSMLSSASEATSSNSLTSAITTESDYALVDSPRTPISPDARASLPSAKEFNEKHKTIDGKASPGLKRAKAKRRSRHADQMTPIETSPRPSPGPDQEVDSPKSTPKAAARFYAGKNVETSPKATSRRSSRDQSMEEKDDDEKDQRLSSVPSMKMPTIPKLRKGGSSTNSALSADTSSDEDEIWPDIQSPSPSSQKGLSDEEDEAPAPPPHRSPSQAQLKNSPVLSAPANRQKRRSSSPLKHEYEPSSASDSSSESDSSTVRHYDMEYSCSDTSDTSDEELEDEDDELPPMQYQQARKSQTPASLPAFEGDDTLSPSNSASQGPYRSVPSQPSKASKAIASLFFWSDKGKWDSLFPDECEVVITPGLIEAYKMTTASSQSPGENSDLRSDGRRKVRPLVALELTPLVPIRRGTAIDISIRSPPTERSKIKTSNNIMFRSRNADECDALYGSINHSRINNPTYIALQNARGPYQPASLSRYNSTGSNQGTSWFGFPRRKNSYRARQAPSIGMASESSVGTMSSAFSALKRFGTGSKFFNIARSTVTSRTGSRDGSTVYSGGVGSSRLTALATAIKGADGIGLSNAKIRLYLRESTTRWRDMGAARLTIMPVTPKPSRPGTAGSMDLPTEDDPSNDVSHAGKVAGESEDEPTADGASTPTPAASPQRVVMPQEKRILIQGKTAGEVLLDVCLGESSFERIARTGIAVSVWEEHAGGGIQQTGGVAPGIFKIYMIQMKSEAEAAYTFGLVGKLRY
ncbi:hypothetical protein UA08_08590 [Talaromyces atroroseus]|uniref:EXPERA domain-containing protein n=1 Tax=Talaromyces atroroseus TaxID=1441469 RepID=A0A225AB19_TALAT|nr:hypothetical protein UA08_08590 [Talaromyces atroroseus]OKL55933.1 hypothetical protein UA08_08590 [Talaromyces atroroseus]